MTASPLPPIAPRAARYAAWIDRHRVAVLLGSLVVAVLSAVVASTLPVHSDFSYLLPPNTQSVKDLRALEKRARVLGTLMVAVRGDDPVRREAVARTLRDRLSALGPALVSSITFDQSIERRYFWDNRWLFAPLSDLQAARDALQHDIDKAKLEQNPLWIDFEDQPAQGSDPAAKGLDDLRRKLKEAEAQKSDPGELVSKDGRLQMMVLHTPFSSGDVERSGRLLQEATAIVMKVRAESPGVEIGLAGDVAVSKAEHRAILNGMLLSTALTVLLCLGALLLYYRSGVGVAAQLWSLTVGTVATFAFTRATVGHLNIATAFLSSIVIGNGINFGIMLLARHMEERRAGRSGLDALAVAIGGTLTGTLAAAMTASVAYASLVITDFRGFRHFGIIGGAGMILCWISAYTVLPAGLAIVERHGWLKACREPSVGRVLEWLLPKRLGVVAALGLAVAGVAGIQTWRYLAHDPYEANFKNLRSDSPEIQEERRWMNAIDDAFGQGISGGFVVAVPRREDVPSLIKRLRVVDEGKPEKEKLFSRVNSIDDLLPSDQEQKLQVLAQIRNLLTDTVLANLSDADRADALRLKPPENLRPLRDHDIPEALAWPFIEADGSRGKMILAMSGWGYEIWDAHDLVRFSQKVRALHLGQGTLLGGAAFIFADMLDLMERDGPRTTLASIVTSILVVAMVVGMRRHGLVTLLCGATGTLLMLAIASLAGLRVNFLDFVALPLTIGIGIDYSVNLSSRERQEGPGSGRRVLATTGGAVFLCSYTTIVGYGSLLMSVNKGIRSFGSAAILGELTCLATALFLAPALLTVFGPKMTSPGVRPAALIPTDPPEEPRRQSCGNRGRG